MVLLISEDPFTTGPDSSKFDAIIPRPPTPPKESPRTKKEKDLLSTNGGTERLQLLSSPGRDTSPPSSSAESGSERPKKRVVWSPWTTYHKPETSPYTPPRARVRPSALTDPKSLKSILKNSSPTPYLGSRSTPDQPLLAYTHTSFASMLESVVQALMSSERSKKLDTYIAFCNTLRAYDDIPDWNAMEKNIPAICGYLKRDLVAKMEEGGNMDSQLIQQATKLLTIICWYERLVNVMDDQSASFFVQHAIQKIEDPHAPKSSVNLYLHFLAQQRFGPKIMTTERCSRIITALETLDERVTGKSITKERIDIYMKLLSQSRAIMIARAPNWMRNAFGGLLNHIKDVRTRSLVFLREAAMVMGKEKAVSRAISSIFNQTNEEGKKMFDYIRRRLEHFIKEGEGQFVSQLWAVLLLLVQSAGDKWDYFNPWLRIIETCFNVSDPDVKVEAQLAWSMLIYTSNISPNTGRKLLDLMCKPLEQYLDPKNLTSNTRKPRRAALSNVCVYLYFGFRPNAAHRQLSDIWDVVMVGLVQKLVLTGGESIDGCNILCSLFDGTAPKKWVEDRVLNGPPFLKIDEIPRLDPKWVRSNCAKVLKTTEAALGRSSWKETDVPSAQLIWKRFTRTLADAGSKEIKIAPELMEAVSHLFNFFQRMWLNGPQGQQSPSDIPFIEKFTFLVEGALESLGTLCFTEKQLVLDESSNFVPAATPTHKYSYDSNHAHRYPPLLHIIRLMIDPPVGVPVDGRYFNCAHRILARCCASQDSRRKKLQLLASCVTLFPRRDVSAVHIGLWDILAELAQSSLPTPPRGRALLSPTPIGGEFRDAVTVLKWGSQQHVSGWDSLFQDLATITQSELGEAYVSMNVVGPLAESLRYSAKDSNRTLIMHRTIILFVRANFTKKKTAVDSISKGHPNLSDRKSPNHDSLENLYALANGLLLRSYKTSDDRESLSSGLELCRAVVGYIARAPAGSIAQLRQVQEGLGVWIKDPSHRLSQINGINSPDIKKLWEKLLLAVEALPRHDSEALLNLHVILASALESRHKATVNSTIKVWNATFGEHPSLNYPVRLRTALTKLRTVIDISLPGFPEDSDDAVIHTPPEFSDSPEESQPVDEVPWASPTPARQLLVESKAYTKSPARETPTRAGRSSTPRRTPVPKPKHMDSQIDFVAIPSTDQETQDSQLITEHQKEIREEQAQVAAWFAQLTSKKPRRRSKTDMETTGSKKPSNDIVNTPINSQRGTQRDMVPETTAKKLGGGASGVMASFISESVIGSPVRSRGSSIARSRDEKQDLRLEEKAPPELLEIDAVEDQPMLDAPSSTPGMKTAYEKQIPEPAIDDPSGEDTFADAPDFPSKHDEEKPPIATNFGTGLRDIPSLKDITDIVDVISPSENNVEYEDPGIPSDTSVPPVAASPSKDSSQKRNGKKRKRTLEKVANIIPEVLDTIVIAKELPSPHPQSIEGERPAKKSRARPATISPMSTRSMRSSAKNAPSKKPEPRSKASSRTTRLDQPIPEPPVSPTPARTRSASSRNSRSTRSSRREQGTLDVALVAEDTPIPDPQAALPQTRVVASIPTRQTKSARLSTNDVAANDLQVTGPRQSMSGAGAGGAPRAGGVRRSKRRSSLTAAVEQQEGNSSKAAIENLRKALKTVNQVDMTAEEMAGIEDEVFAAFSELRDRRRTKMGEQ